MQKLIKSSIIGIMFLVMLAALVNAYFPIFGSVEDYKKEVVPDHQIKEVTFSGNIEAGYTYAVEVYYAATKDTGACTSYSLFHGKSKNVKTLRYPATIESGKHTITFPINELSPTKDCKWVPVLVSLCAGIKSIPQENYCNEFLNMRKSGTTSKGIPLRSYNSNAEKAINVQCIEIKYDPGYWYCARTEPPDADKPKSAYQKSSPLVLFSGMKGIDYPFDREDVYWFDIDFLPVAEQQ